MKTSRLNGKVRVHWLPSLMAWERMDGASLQGPSQPDSQTRLIQLLLLRLKRVLLWNWTFCNRTLWKQPIEVGIEISNVSPWMCLLLWSGTICRIDWTD